MPLNLLALYTV